jgi:hypothetical protein
MDNEDVIAEGSAMQLASGRVATLLATYSANVHLGNHGGE